MTVIELLSAGQGRYPSEKVSRVSEITPLESLRATTDTGKSLETRYSPSLGELRCWFAAARITQDEALQTQISGLAVQLKDMAGGELPSTDFRNPSVTLSLEEQTQMQRQIQPILELGTSAKTTAVRSKEAPEISEIRQVR
jgi:hypothetical protein